jgi:hypothetical protein
MTKLMERASIITRTDLPMRGNGLTMCNMDMAFKNGMTGLHMKGMFFHDVGIMKEEPKVARESSHGKMDQTMKVNSLTMLLKEKGK